jgi:integrase
MLPLVQLALETGMRRSELLALDWKDVFLDEAYARLHDSKNGDARDVPLSSQARCVLGSMPGNRVGPFFP